MSNPNWVEYYPGVYFLRTGIEVMEVSVRVNVHPAIGPLPLARVMAYTCEDDEEIVYLLETAPTLEEAKLLAEKVAADIFSKALKAVSDY